MALCYLQIIHIVHFDYIFFVIYVFPRGDCCFTCMFAFLFPFII